MIPTLSSLARWGLSGLPLVFLTVGCVDDKSTLFIQGVVHREAPTCLAQPDPAGVMLGSGILDVALADEYFATFLVGNQYTPRGDKSRMRTETTRVILQEAVISLATPGGNVFFGPRTVAGSGVVPPNSGADPGWGLFSAVIIGGGLAGSAAGEIDVRVKVRGETTGGQKIESGEFLFPVHICSGCLVTYPLSALVTDPTTGVSTCSATTTDTPPVTGCSFGQDDPVDCRTCTSLSVCRTVPK